MEDNYKAWGIKDSEFPKSGGIEDQIIFFCKFGSLAPSIHNTQPWNFQVRENILSIFPNWNLQLQNTDATGRCLFISLGCCITNILSVSAFYGFKGIVLVRSSKIKKNSYIEIIFKKEKNIDKELKVLYPFIVKRFSNKFPYKKNPIDEDILKRLRRITIVNNIDFSLTNNRFIIKEMALLHKKAVLRLSKNRGFRKELSFWLRPSNTKMDDGMPGFVVGFNNFQSRIIKYILLYLPNSMNILAKKDEKLIDESPSVGVISSNEENIESWINVGRLYEKIALTSISCGTSITPMHAIVDYEDLSEKTIQLFNLKDKKPQFFFRLGFSSNKPYHTPRRDINKMLL